jgi:hypothetical protein
MKLYFRFFAECRDLHEAHDISARLCAPLSAFHLAPSSEPKAYWKIPELFEFRYELQSAAREDYDKVVSCGNGWLHMDNQFELCSVWNRSGGEKLFIDGVTWAEAQLVS